MADHHLHLSTALAFGLFRCWADAVTTSGAHQLTGRENASLLSGRRAGRVWVSNGAAQMPSQAVYRTVGPGDSVADPFAIVGR